MRLKRSNAGMRVCVLVSFAVLAATTLAPAPALALPEGRHYEMVSPPYKAGYGTGWGTGAVAPDGESLAFTSQGVFNGTLMDDPLGNSYIARRGPTGWTTTSLMPPSTLVPVGFIADFSSTLHYTLFKGYPGPNADAATSENVFLLHSTDTPDTEESWKVAGLVLEGVHRRPLNVGYPGASADLCHILVDEPGPDPLLPSALGAETQLYELLRGCGGEPASLRLVGLNNKDGIIDSACTPELGGEFASGGRSRFNAISADGSEVFFTTNVNPAVGSKCGYGVPANPDQLFVRLGGARTLEVSRPLDTSKPFGGCEKEVAPGEELPGEVPCDGAVKRADAFFEGASEKGTIVFFSTTAPLEPGTDTDSGSDLYMARIGCPGGEAEGCEVAQRVVRSLVQVSHGTEPAEVQGVVRVAPDGSRVYFVARGVLASEGPTNTEAEGARSLPVKGADNLYVYDTASGRTVFVADLCSGPEASGKAEEPRCPAAEGIEGKRDDLGLLSGSQREAQSTPDGGVLVFSSYGRLLANDMDNAKDVYRYDAVTGRLERVSLGEAGHDANGNGEDSVSKPVFADATIEPYLGASERAYEQHEMQTRAVSEDGSRIVFETAGPLSGAAVNHRVNVYEWHDGSVSLVSSGNSLTDDCCAVISPSGRDLFFMTAQGLVPQDTDGAMDIYDARLGGGFPPVLAQRQPCSGDACQGPLTNPAPLLVPGSVPQAPGQNFAAPSKPAVKAKKGKPKKVKPKKRHGKKGKASGRSGQARKSAGRSGR
jgi:hypothetical protein